MYWICLSADVLCFDWSCFNVFFFVKICFVCASKLLGHSYITTVRVRQEQIFSFFQLDVFEHF